MSLKHQKRNLIERILNKYTKVLLRINGEIEKILPIDDKFIILLKPNEHIGNRNVFCYDVDGNLLWQIPFPVIVPGHSGHSSDFTGIYLRGTELYAYQRSGIEYHLDKISGLILRFELIK